MSREADISRKTTETDIQLAFNLDGSGDFTVDTSVPFLDHMLSLMAKHGLFDLKIKAKGDVEIDFHHTVEDVGICLGEALKKALGNKEGIKRYGAAYHSYDGSPRLCGSGYQWQADGRISCRLAQRESRQF